MYKFFLQGIEVNAPKEWQDIEVLATFSGGSVLPNISIDTFVFTGSEARTIRGIVASGNIFEGVPFSIQAVDGTEYTIFDGYIDLTEDYKEDNAANQVQVKLKKKDGANLLADKSEANTWGYLEATGAISQADYNAIDYVVEKPFDLQTIIANAIVGIILVKTLIDQIRDFAKDRATSSGIAVSGVTGPAGATVYEIAVAIIDIVYFASIVTAVVKFSNNLFKAAIPPRRQGKVASFLVLWQKMAQYLGYGFETSILNFANYHYLPSNNNYDIADSKGFIQFPKGTSSGIPNTGDFGYRLSEFIELTHRLFYSKISIIDGVIQLHTRKSDYLIKQSSYQAPPTLQATNNRYNTQDLSANLLLSFNTDITDDWTIENHTGTVYEVITTLISITNEKANLIKGLTEVSIPCALGTRKDKLNGPEKGLKVLATAVDALINTFGGNSSYAKKIKDRVGLLKVSNNNYSIPKILYLENGKIPTNHRTKLSAKALYENYHNERSFVQNDFGGQEIIKDNIKVSFSLSDFLLLINNNYFYTEEGKEAEVKSIKATLAMNNAILDYREKSVYTRNLQENFIEP